MRMINIDKVDDKIVGYTMTLSADDTEQFAQSWPCSTISGEKITIVVDSNGLCDYDGPESAGDELAAIVTDNLPEKYNHLWPVWNI